MNYIRISVPSIPNVPVPPPISFASISTPTSTSESTQEVSREDELKNVKLKSAVKIEQKPKELSMYNSKRKISKSCQRSNTSSKDNHKERKEFFAKCVINCNKDEKNEFTETRRRR